MFFIRIINLSIAVSFMLFFFVQNSYAQSNELKEAFKNTKEAYKVGKLDKALSYAKNAIYISEKEFGFKNEITATLIENLGEIEMGMEQYKDAEKSFRISTSIRKEILEADNPEKEIFMYINSPGGVITSGFGILDTMNYIKPDICTICMGQAASMAAVLLSAGTKGKRSALENSRIMIHQPLGGVQGQATDIEIHTKEILYLRDKLNKIMSDNTGKSVKTIEKDTNRDNFMAAEVALKYGIIDQIVKTR